MPKLPTFDAVGVRDPRAVYRGPTYPTDDPVARAMGMQAKAQDQLGKAMLDVGRVGASLSLGAYEEEGKARTVLEHARADADFASRTRQLEAAREQETDPDKLAGYEQRQRQILDESAGNFSDPKKAELWRTLRSPMVVDQSVKANRQAQNLRTNAALAADDERLVEIERQAASAKTPDELLELSSRANLLVTAQEKSGFIDARQAGVKRRAIATGLAEKFYMSRPPEERLKLLGPDEPEPAPATGLAGAIKSAATELGISAHDLATVISYETGGKFSPSIRGGAGNRHIGLIQFGAAEQKAYGAHQGQTVEEQMQAVVRYLKDRGLKPGMGLLDLYSTINAGRPGLYHLSDANNGGAPGTVRDKVERQMGAHKAKAAAILGDGGDAPVNRTGAPTAKPLVIADSLGVGVSQASGGGATSNAVEGRPPGEVFRLVNAAPQAAAPGQPLVISAVSNDVDAGLSGLPGAVQAAKSKGYQPVVMGVGPKFGADVNAKIKSATEAAGGVFVPLPSGEGMVAPDGVHLTGAGYKAAWGTIQAATGGAAGGAPAPQPQPAGGQVLPPPRPATSSPDVYSLIPDEDEAGRAGQVEKFKAWNPDPIGNHERNLSSVKPQLQDVIRKAQEDNPGLRFVVASGARDNAQQDVAKRNGWSPFGIAAHSKHGSGEAADVWPLDEQGRVVFEKGRQAAIGAAIKKAAADLGVPLQWGGDWKKADLPHFEVKPGYERVAARSQPAAAAASAGGAPPAGGAAPATVQPASPQSAGEPFVLSPVAQVLSFEQRKRIRESARRELATQERDNEKTLKVERAQLTTRLNDDLASVERSGQGIPDLNSDTVRKTLGDEAANQWQAERARARNVYEALDGIETLSEGEIEQRLKRLEPRPGTDGYVDDTNTYQRARQKADAFLQARRADPALAVDNFPTVKAARSEAQYTQVGDLKVITPESAQRIVAQRMAAQEQIGIQEPMAVTKSQAREIARQLRTRESNGEMLRSFMTKLHSTYGQFADDVLISTIQHANVNRDLAVATTDLLNSMMRGQPPTPGAVTRADRLQDDQAASDALAGKPAPVPGDTFSGMTPAPVETPSAVPARPSPAARATPDETKMPELTASPTGEHLQRLDRGRDDKKTRDDFNEIYGGGKDVAAATLRWIDRRKKAIEAAGR